MPEPGGPVAVVPSSFDPLIHCGARTRGASVCLRESGWGTEHFGQGRCKLHGGASNGRPLLHGRYSNRSSIMERIEEIKQSPELLSIETELAAAKAVIEIIVERYGVQVEEYDQELKKWQDGVREDAPPTPPTMPLDAFHLVDRMAKTGYDMRFDKRFSIPIAELQDVLSQIKAAFVDVQREFGLPDAAVQAFAARLSGLKLSRGFDAKLERAGRGASADVEHSIIEGSAMAIAGGGA